MAAKTTKRNKAQEALTIAEEIAATAKDSQEFWNALFGIGGRLTDMFGTRAAREQFARTDEHAKIMGMFAQFQADEGNEPEAVPDAKARFVLRLPRSVQSALT